jgi:hypothetical protein
VIGVSLGYAAGQVGQLVAAIGTGGAARPSGPHGGQRPPVREGGPSDRGATERRSSAPQFLMPRPLGVGALGRVKAGQ